MILRQPPMKGNGANSSKLSLKDEEECAEIQSTSLPTTEREVFTMTTYVEQREIETRVEEIAEQVELLKIYFGAFRTDILYGDHASAFWKAWQTQKDEWLEVELEDGQIHYYKRSTIQRVDCFGAK